MRMDWDWRNIPQSSSINTTRERSPWISNFPPKVKVSNQGFLGGNFGIDRKNFSRGVIWYKNLSIPMVKSQKLDERRDLRVWEG